MFSSKKGFEQQQSIRPIMHGSTSNSLALPLIDNRVSLPTESTRQTVTQPGEMLQREIISPFSQESSDSSINDIQREVHKFNILEASGHSFLERKAALEQLSLVEGLIYQWFNNQQEIDLDAKPEALKMKGLMNLVQQARTELVEQSIQQQDTEAPVVGIDHLPEIVRLQVNSLWQKLLKGEGIKISDDGEFQTRMMSDFSRLLQVEMGRRLISGIIMTGKGLEIVPVANTGKFAASPEDPDLESMRRVKPSIAKLGEASSSSSSAMDSDVSFDSSGFVALDFRHRNQAQRLDVLQDLRVYNPQSKGVVIKSENGEQPFSFGEGVGSRITVPDGMRDAMPHASSRMADETGYEIIAPTFITLGHELGHVLRSAQGMSASADGRALIEHGFPGVENHDRPEEFFNIGGVENSLRLESGIVPRHDHGNLYSFWAVRAMNNVEKMERQIEGLLTNIAGTREERRVKNIQVDINDYLRPRILKLMAGKEDITSVINLLTKLKQDILNML